MNSFKGSNKLLICCALAFVFSAVGWVSVDRASAADEAVKCTDCHTDKQGAKFPHPPAAEGECTACHEPEPAHLTEGGPGKMKTGKTAATCYQCHENMAAGKNVHPALQMDGECIQCHNPHGSSVEKLLLSPVGTLCKNCHDMVPAEAATTGSQHLAVSQGKACVNCHNPHSSDQAKLLIAPPKTLCLGCHDKKISRADGKGTIENIKEKMGLEYVHAPASDDDGCITCHAPHGSKYKKLLKDSFPGQNYYTVPAGTDVAKNVFGLCFGCHDQALLKEDISASDTGFQNDTVENGKVVRKNLHRFHVMKTATRGRSCNICHDPHGASQPHNLRSKWTMKSYEPALQYESKPDGGECLKSCHSPKSYKRLD
jgi:predicted CXXCH cytochrome family protein